MCMTWVNIAFSEDGVKDFQTFKRLCQEQGILQGFVESEYVQRTAWVYQEFVKSSQPDIVVFYEQMEGYWNKQNDRPCEGLGDTIAKITHATGLSKLSEIYTQITGKPCHCRERQDALNKLFPYGVREDGL